MAKRIAAALAAVLVLLCCRVARADDAASAYRRGLAEERAGQYHAALRDFYAALDADPSYAQAQRQLGNCYYYLGEKADAVDAYDRYLQSYPDDRRLRAFADSLGGPAGGYEGTGSYASYKGAITVNPISLIIGLADLQYEQRLNLGSSLAYRLELWDLSAGDVSLSAYGAAAFYHLYPAHHALHGFYWGPGLSCLDVGLKVTDPTTNDSATGSGFLFGPGIELGWQWVPFDAWAIDLGLTESYYIGSVSATSDGTKASASLSGFNTGVRLGFGYAWR